MEIKGYIDSYAENYNSFSFLLNKRGYKIYRTDESIGFINQIRDSAIGGYEVIIDCETKEYCGKYITTVRSIQTPSKTLMSLDFKDYTKPKRFYVIGNPKPCSFCEHIYIRSKEHRYGDDCIVWDDDDECEPPMFKLYMSGDYMPIGYCPMCGRKLKDIQSE